MSFKEKWLEAVERKNSVVCAGLDPAEYDMRKDDVLPEGTNKLGWTLDYIKAVAPFCAAVKPNVQYWKNNLGMQDIETITFVAHENGLVVIDDSKLADIGSTNDAGMYHAQKKNIDAITLACFAGNMQEAAEQLRKRNLGGIHMCLMSNKEYEQQKNKLVPLISDDKNNYELVDLVRSAEGHFYARQYLHLAVNAKRFGLDGIVIGAPSKTNHISEDELKKVRRYFDDLILLPGIGKQGGEAELIWKYFDPMNVIVNVGRNLMFPKGPNSTPTQQAERARYYQEMLNSLRKAA